MNDAEQKIAEICEKDGILTPLEFLTQLMGGKDPRRISAVYHFIDAHENMNGDEPPDEFDWLELVDLIKKEYKYSIVEISKSQDAAKQLMEYSHPKRKAVEKTNKSSAIETATITRREARNLRKAFDLDY